MNNYWSSLLSVHQSIEIMLENEYQYLDIKDSAKNLRQSLKLCFQELEGSAGRLNQLVLRSLDELDEAERVWQNKPKIRQLSPLEMWEKVENLTGRSLKIQHLSGKWKQQAFEKIKAAWLQQVQAFEKKWFNPTKISATKDNLSSKEKEQFFQELEDLFNKIHEDIIDSTMEDVYGVFNQEISDLRVAELNIFTDLLSRPEKHYWSEQTAQIMNEVNEKFFETKFESQESIAFKQQFDSDLEKFKKQNKMSVWENIIAGGGGISLMEVQKLQEKFLNLIQQYIDYCLNRKVKLAIKCVEHSIRFFAFLLEKQTRYREETQEQREAEKAWIDQQRRQLEQVQQGIEAILN